MTTIIKVNDMMCQHCTMHVKEALMALKDVTNVEVDLASKEATITSSVPLKEADLKAAIEEADYEFGGIVKAD